MKLTNLITENFDNYNSEKETVKNLHKNAAMEKRIQFKQDVSSKANEWKNKVKDKVAGITAKKFNRKFKNKVKGKDKVSESMIYESNLEKCAAKGCKNTVKGYEDEDYATNWTVDLNTKKGYCEEHRSNAGKNKMVIPIDGSMGPKDDIAKLVKNKK